MECSVFICVTVYLSINLSIDLSIHSNPSIDRVLIRSSYSEIETSTAPTALTQQTRNTWRNLAHPSDVSPSWCRSAFFPSSNGQESSAGLAMKHKCSSASSCSQKRHTRWHVSWPLRSEALRAVSSAAVRISACVPLFPTVTPRAEKPHARSLPSPPRRHIRHLRGIS